MFAMFLFALANIVEEHKEAITTAAAGAALAAPALIALMRKHRAKVKELAAKLGVPTSQVTKARKGGITDPAEAKKWWRAITGQEDDQPQEPQEQPPPEDKPPISPSALLLPANLASLSKLVDKNASRFGGTAGVHLMALEGGGYRAEATNGRILGMVKGNFPDDLQNYPNVPAIQAAPNGATVGTIPADAWYKAFKAVPAKKGTKPILGNLVAVLGNSQATLVSTDLENVNVLEPRLVEGRWPDTDKILPTEKPRYSIDVDAKLLIDLLQVAADFANGDDCRRVTLDLHDPKKPIAVRTKSESGQEFTGLIVPLVPTSPTRSDDAPVSRRRRRRK